MNKKFSTLLTAGLLMAGSALNSAWADKLPISTAATALEDGKSYVLVQSNNAYGFASVNDEGKISETFVANPTTDENVAPEMIPAYIWKVSISQVGTAYAYTFTNSLTGQVLRYNTTAGSEKIELDTNVAASKTSSAFVFDGYGKYSETVKHLIGEKYVTAASASGTAYVGLTTDGGMHMGVGVVEALAATDFYLVESQSVTTATELNTLYNNKGVSFEVNGKDVVGNIFADKRLEAYYLENAKNIDAANDLKIPAGMYFFTEKVMDGNKIDWLNSSVLAVSSTETVEVTNADRAAGKGFEVVEVRIGDMNLYTGTTNAKKSSGSEISVYNAAFTVNKSYTSSYPYALTVAGFRYQKDASKDDHAGAAVRLGVLTHGGVNYLASQKADDPIYTFKKVATTAIKGIEFLNTDATVAAYGIRFLNGKANDVKTVYGKYLTVGADASAYEWVAKGDVIADLNTPSFQFIITAVNGTNVTFTNRETGKAFTATLFPTDEENVYTWAIVSDEEVKSVYVDENTYAVKAATDAAYTTNLSDATIELIPVAVDKYAGFANVDDKTLVTLSFARDNYITSNKVYATVYDFGTTIPSYKLVDGAKFATNVYGAAQWQLVKSEKPVVLAARTYVWNNDEKITSVAKGDTLAAYTYNFRYVVDGTEQDAYLPKTISTSNALNATQVGNFYIKENVDGSISLLAKSTGIANSAVNAIKTKFENGWVKYATADTKAYAYTSAATDMRVYLNIEAPEVSLPATATYVTLQSELGNYVSMNAEKDGIVVSNEPLTMRVFATDETAVVPSFLISTGWNAESTSRDFLFNPADSVDYLVAAGTFDKKYQVREDATKAIFKAGILNETADTLTTGIKGKVANVAVKADNKGTLGGLNRFKFQIISAGDDYYRIRQTNAGYLAAINGKLIFGADAAEAMLFTIADTVSPTANEAIAAEGVQVIAGKGTVTVQGAAGKVITVANILGQTIANQVAASDNVTIAAPAGVVVVAVDGDATKVVVK